MSKTKERGGRKGWTATVRTPTCLGSLSASLGKAKQSVSIKDSLAAPLVIPRSTRIRRFLEVVHARKCTTRPAVNPPERSHRVKKGIQACPVHHRRVGHNLPPGIFLGSPDSGSPNLAFALTARSQSYPAFLLRYAILDCYRRLKRQLIAEFSVLALSESTRGHVAARCMGAPPSAASIVLSRPVWLTDPQVSRAPVFAFFGAIFVRNAVIDTTSVFASRQRR